MDTFEIIDLKSFSHWNDCLCRLPDKNIDIYFSPSYYRLHEELTDGIAKCFIFYQNNDIALYPFLQNCINDLGYQINELCYDIQGAYGYNGIISTSYDTQFINKFFESFAGYCKKSNIIAEFTRFHPLLTNHEFSKNHISIVDDRKTVMIDLNEGYSAIWENQYTSKNRNMVRKAIKLGYEIQILENPEKKDLNTFINIYYYSMKMAHADSYFYFNKSYFNNIFKYLSKNAYLFNVVNKEQHVMCSSIFFKFGNYFHYHLSGRHKNANNSVNNFLIDRAIFFAKESGATYFHLGGGRSEAENDSLLKFKKSFSKNTNVFYIGKRVHNQEKYEQIVKEWENKNPEKIFEYKNFLLKYRY